jgi:peptidoglycan hydrolase-like protein with peptidoglycan-binding domain
MATNYNDPAIVKQVQKTINDTGYTMVTGHAALVVDGIVGPLTQAGVKWFQGVHHLVQDGIIGPLTLAATIAALPDRLDMPLAPVSAPINLSGLGYLGNVKIPAAPITPPVTKLSLPGTGGNLAQLAQIAGVAPPPKRLFQLVGSGSTAVAAPPVPIAQTPTPQAAFDAPMPQAPAASSKVPAWAATAAGAAIGLAIMFPIGGAIGAAGGALIDLLRAKKAG